MKISRFATRLSRQQGTVLMITTLFMLGVCALLTVNSKNGTKMDVQIANANQIDIKGQNLTEEALIEGEREVDIMNTENMLDIAVNKNFIDGNVLDQSLDWTQCGFMSKSVPNALIAIRFMAREVIEGESLNEIPAKDDVSYKSNFFLVDVIKTHAKLPIENKEITEGEKVSYLCKPKSKKIQQKLANIKSTPRGSWEMQTIYSIDANDT